jgi:hypothetical protein
MNIIPDLLRLCSPLGYLWWQEVIRFMQNLPLLDGRRVCTELPHDQITRSNARMDQ